MVDKRHPAPVWVVLIISCRSRDGNGHGTVVVVVYPGNCHSLQTLAFAIRRCLA